jgi:hypothetical protein
MLVLEIILKEDGNRTLIYGSINLLNFVKTVFPYDKTFNYFKKYFIPLFITNALKFFIKLLEYVSAHFDVFIYVCKKLVCFEVKRRDETVGNIREL